MRRIPVDLVYWLKNCPGKPVRHDEAGNIRKLHTRLATSTSETARNAVQHIVDFKCSASLAIDHPDINHPRASMRQLLGMVPEDQRDLHISVMKEYLPLQLIDTPDELITIFQHGLTDVSYYSPPYSCTSMLTICDIGHHWAWVEVGVLHRDINLPNLMFYRENKDVIGVLCDWGFSASRAHIGEEDPLTVDKDAYKSVENLAYYPIPSGNSPPKPFDAENTVAVKHDAEDEVTRKRKDRTGTGPFMALDLLEIGIAPTHLYRHESLRILLLGPHLLHCDSQPQDTYPWPYQSMDRYQSQCYS